MPGDAITVFFSYSHKDEALRDELANHLRILERQGVIASWHDRRILPGEEWDHQINSNLIKADIILLLISSDFLSSNYCWDVEIVQAMARHVAGEARVVPVILRPSLWSSAPFGSLQALPQNASPVTDPTAWPTKDAAFTNIAEGIRKAANEIRQQLIAMNQAKLNQYEVAYRQAIQKEYPPNELAQGELRYLQTNLNFSDAVINSIETRLRAEYEYSQKLEKYRNEVHVFLDEDGGEISVFSRSFLDVLRTNLMLVLEDAIAIEQDELEAIRKKIQAIEDYKKALADALQHEKPLGEVVRRQFKRFQHLLQLSDEEVHEIELSMIGPRPPIVEPPIVEPKELGECDSSRLLFLKNIRDPSGDWSYTLERIGKMNSSPTSRVFELYWLPTGKGANAPSQGDLMILNQRARVTHIVEMLNNEVRKTEAGYFRWVRIVWMPKQKHWHQLPHQRDVLGFEPPQFGGGATYSFNSPNFGKFRAAWDDLSAFQRHVFEALKNY